MDYKQGISRNNVFSLCIIKINTPPSLLDNAEGAAEAVIDIINIDQQGAIKITLWHRGTL